MFPWEFPEGSTTMAWTSSEELRSVKSVAVVAVMQASPTRAPHLQHRRSLTGNLDRLNGASSPREPDMPLHLGGFTPVTEDRHNLLPYLQILGANWCCLGVHAMEKQGESRGLRRASPPLHGDNPIR